MKNIVVALFVLIGGVVKGQLAQPYAVYFVEKTNTHLLKAPTSFVTQRSAERRAKQNIAFTKADLPVSKDRLHAVEGLATYMGHASKWLNAVYAEMTPQQLLAVQQLAIVDTVVALEGLWGTVIHDVDPKAYGYAEFQADQINLIHGLAGFGYRGNGMLIAILDAGFTGGDVLIPSEQVIGTKDFVYGGTDVYHSSGHGLSVWSCIGTEMPYQMLGTAPEAQFILGLTEDVTSETPAEMFNWIAGAEYADSCGADIINTSLGYYHFDDATDNYTLDDLDGRTSIITLGAVAAARTGMLLCTSAGNEGGGPWNKITFPGDADSILTVGSVNRYHMASGFSSRGYTADGRVKPNVCAMGEGATVMRTDGSLAYANGTSFSSPIMAGACAALWEAHPEATAQEIIAAVERSASHYNYPNVRIGYGIPNLMLADLYLKVAAGDLEASNLMLYPNPFVDFLHVFAINGAGEQVQIEVYNSVYQLMATDYFTLPNDKYMWQFPETLPVGTYWVKVYYRNEVVVHKMIKV